MPSLAKFVLLASVFVLAGYATTNPRASLLAVQSQLRELADVPATWPLTADERAQAATATRELRAHELTVAHAVQIALPNYCTLPGAFVGYEPKSATFVHHAGLIHRAFQPPLHLPTFPARFSSHFCGR